jgi:hypothetical protein
MELLKAMEEMMERMDAAHEMMMAKLDAHQAKMDASQAKVGTSLKEIKEDIKAKVKAMLDAYLEKMEAADLAANPEDVESIEEGQKAPKEEAAVRSSGALKKRHRSWHLPVGRHGEPEERTRG